MMEYSFCRMLRRAASVGWAVKTGRIRNDSRAARTSAEPTPEAFNSPMTASKLPR